MNDFEAIMEKIVANAIRNNPPVEGDYTGEDGLLHCGKCHGARQMRDPNVMGGRLLPILCPCRLEEQEREKEREKRKRADELRAYCLPDVGMHRHTFDSAADAKHIRVARRYVDKWEEVQRDNIGLTFLGNTGTGKSFTAQCIANALLDRHIPVRYMTAVELVSALTDKETKRGEFMQKIRDVPLLIIDDLGAERDTPFAREQLCAVIDTRCESRKPLIVTTNYTKAEMEQCADPTMQRIFNRLKAICVPVAVTGKSRRDELGERKIQKARELLYG